MLRVTLQKLQIKAEPEHLEPSDAIAVKNTCDADGMVGAVVVGGGHFKAD